MRKRILYSQNFLKNPALAKMLIGKFGISKKDTVLEIGAGNGIITKLLIAKAGKVIAYEKDQNLVTKLKRRFYNNPNLNVKGNFLSENLPEYDYKVFANIPFSITSEIVKKLLLSKNPPLSLCLFIQKEAAEKFIGQPYTKTNSLVSLFLKPIFYMRVDYKFKKRDFYPESGVDVVAISVTKKNSQDIENMRLWRDFLTYSFSQTKPNLKIGLSKIFSILELENLAQKNHFSVSVKPSQLEYKNWLLIFSYFEKHLKKNHKMISDSYQRLLYHQYNLRKTKNL